MEVSDTPNRRTAGYTLMEVMVTVAVLAVLLTIAGPGLRDLILDNRMAAEVNTFVASLRLARSEAIKRNRRVVICPSADAEACAPDAEWKHGWMVFEDRNRNRTRDTDEPILGKESGLAVETHVSSGERRAVIYYPNGMSGGSNATFTFCDGRGAPHARAVILSNAGRHRLSRKQPRGTSLECEDDITGKERTP